MSTARCGKRSFSISSPTPSSSPSRERSRFRCASGQFGGGDDGARHRDGHSGRGNSRICSSVSIASKARADAPMKAAASGSRWCRSWLSCMAAMCASRAKSITAALYRYYSVRERSLACRPHRRRAHSGLNRVGRRRVRARSSTVAAGTTKYRRRYSRVRLAVSPSTLSRVRHMNDLPAFCLRTTTQTCASMFSASSASNTK